MKIFLAGTASVIIHIIILTLFLKLYYIPNKHLINKKSRIQKSLLLLNSEYIQKTKIQKKIEKPKPKPEPVKQKLIKTEKKKPNNNFNNIKPPSQTTYKAENFYSENSGQKIKNTAADTAADNKKKLKQTPPVYKNTPPPTYPKLAKKRGHKGTTIIDALIGINGKIKEIKTNNSSGYEILDNAAVEAVKKWLFIPASVGDKKIEMRVTIPIKFEITD
ncbi:MAG: energy transducer TonB [Deltaproteobacteria bacterium]|nr:energy transducer TonB [Deltaproteobacteria bacterium]